MEDERSCVFHASMKADAEYWRVRVFATYPVQQMWNIDEIVEVVISEESCWLITRHVVFITKSHLRFKAIGAKKAWEKRRTDWWVSISSCFRRARVTFIAFSRRVSRLDKNSFLVEVIHRRTYERTHEHMHVHTYATETIYRFTFMEACTRACARVHVICGVVEYLRNFFGIFQLFFFYAYKDITIREWN